MTSTDPKLRSEPESLENSAVGSGAENWLDAASKPTAADLDAKTLMGIEEAADDQNKQVSVGGTVGKYEIRSQLGTGGMGAVYLAFDPLIEREVALKVLSPDIGNSSIAVQRFLGEARAIGRLNHPNVVSIYDIGQWNGQYYLVMELLSGGSVADRVDQNGRLPWREACRLISEAARGLAAAHAAGMIHRDIKPENLMLTKDGSVKVVDFGLSKLLDSSHDPQKAITKAGQILGTPQYMSPEQFEATETDARTDIYSLGATLFRLLTARFPYDDCRSIVQVMTAHLTKAPPVATVFDPMIPVACDRIVARAMAKSPADRYQTATELATDLESLLQGLDKPTTPAAVGSTGADHPLHNVVIVEPSKLQGAILRDAFLQAGARAVAVLANIESATKVVTQERPDLLITAMQLPDGRGIDFIKDLCHRTQLSEATVVLNSSDSTIEELVSVGPAACLILAPKKVKPEEILRVVHAAGPCVVQGGALSEPINPAALRLKIVLDSGRIPDVLADIIRDLELLDVEVSAVGTHAAGSPAADLTLLLRREPPSGENAIQAIHALRSVESSTMSAAVQFDRGKLHLCAVIRNNVVVVCDRILDIPRLVCLLQGCR